MGRLRGLKGRSVAASVGRPGHATCVTLFPVQGPSPLPQTGLRCLASATLVKGSGLDLRPIWHMAFGPRHAVALHSESI